MAQIGICADLSSRDVKLLADSSDSNGPTVTLSYSGLAPVKNPTSSFMYFIPLVSPVLVETEISLDNEQQAAFTAYEKKVGSNSFLVSCEFEMHGSGFFVNIFDANEIIATFGEEIKKNVPVKNVLDYIRLEGEGLGRIDVKGTIIDSNMTVTQVDVHFSTKGKKSPVTIGLYSVKSQNGQYKYENRYNEIVTRVATLTFKKTEGEPRMDIEVVSINKASKPNSYIGRVKGFVVNFFIEPIKISRLGNATMLDFGHTILNKKHSFTFPKAKNIRQALPVKINNKQENKPAGKPN